MDRDARGRRSLVPSKIFSIVCPKMIMPCLCGYCGGAVDSITSVHTQLHRSQGKGKISGCFKNSTSVVRQHYHNEEDFQRKGSGIALKFFTTYFKCTECSLVNTQHC